MADRDPYILTVAEAQQVRTMLRHLRKTGVLPSQPPPESNDRIIQGQVQSIETGEGQPDVESESARESADYLVVRRYDPEKGEDQSGDISVAPSHGKTASTYHEDQQVAFVRAVTGWRDVDGNPIMYRELGAGLAQQYPGLITNSGPSGESDKTGATYWVKQADPSGTSAQDPAGLLAYMTEPSMAGATEPEWHVEAVNLAEIGSDSHDVRDEGRGLFVNVFRIAVPEETATVWFFARDPSWNFPATFDDDALAFTETSAWAGGFQARSGSATEINGRSWSVTGDKTIVRQRGVDDWRVDLRHTADIGGVTVPSGTGGTADSTTWVRDTDKDGLALDVITQVYFDTGTNQLKVFNRKAQTDPHGDWRQVDAEASLATFGIVSTDQLVSITDPGTGAIDTPDTLEAQITAGAGISIANDGDVLTIAADVTSDELVSVAHPSTGVKDTPATLDVQLSAGTGISLNNDGDVIEIENTGSGANNQVAVKSGCTPGFLDAVLNTGPASGGGAEGDGDIWINEAQEGTGGCTLVLRHAAPQTESSDNTGETLTQVNDGTDEVLRLSAKGVGWDDKGHVTASKSETSDLTLTAVTVVTDVRVNGTDLEKKTQTIYVPKADAESGWTVWHSGTTCP